MQFGYHKSYHSDQVSVSKDGLSAVKENQWTYYAFGIVYSDRSLTGKCEFEVKLSGHTNVWSGSLKLGIAEFPSGKTLNEFEIPRYSPEGKNLCVWSENKIRDYRMGRSSETRYGDFNLNELKEGDRVGLKITKHGVLSFFFNGKYQGVAVRDVYKRGYDVYALVDHYGQAYASVITKATMESSITEEGELVGSLKKQLKDLQEEKEEGDREIQHLKKEMELLHKNQEQELQKRLNDLQLQHEGELNTLQQTLLQEQQELVQRKQVEIRSLQDCLQSCPKKEQLKELEEKKEEGDREIQHLKREMELLHKNQEQELQKRLNDLQLQHEGELNTLQQTLQEQQELVKRKQVEIRTLQDRLQSCPWVLEREEVVVTDERLGVGAFGEVRVAIFRGTKVAAKCLHQLIVSNYNRGIFIREMEISSRIHHPNIVQFVGATRVNNPILLYELMATSLYKKLQDDQPLTHPQIIGVCSDIVSALSYLHQWRPDPIIHRDVSSPNVLMEPLANSRWRSKLSDFGSANLQLRVKTVIPGNPAYASPEALIPQYHSPAMDVYSFGVLTTEMILNCPPEMDDAKRQQQAQNIDWKPMRVLVLKCMNHEHTQRPTSLQLLKEIEHIN